MISFYNNEVEKFKTSNTKKKAEDFVDKSLDKIKWNKKLFDYANKGTKISYDASSFRECSYRPYTKENLYYNKDLNWSFYLLPKLFPQSDSDNKVICIQAPGCTQRMSPIITNQIFDLHYNGDTQAFPLYYYEELDSNDMFASKDKYVRRDAISDAILKQARAKYSEPKIRKEDLFYYVYGFLHSIEYRSEFASDLRKMLPRIPLVDESDDFWSFSKSGRALAELHLNYEKVKPFDAQIVATNSKSADLPLFSGNSVDCRKIYKNIPQEQLYHVVQMRFAKSTVGRNGKPVDDKSRIVYNERLTIANIPLEAYEYDINGKSAVEWIMERYAITKNEKSGIVDDPNDWAIEHNNPAYIFDLVLRVITVSVETMKIVKALPKVKF